MSQDYAEYYTLHGCRVEQRPDRTWEIIVPMRCPQLGVDNLCKIHEKKPRLCASLNEKNKDRFYITEGCLLK